MIGEDAMKLFCKSKKFFSICLLLLFVLSSKVTNIVMAVSPSIEDVPSNSYSYWTSSSKNILVNQKAVFKFKETISASLLGINPFSTLADMAVDDNGYIYLIDKDTNELIIIDNKYNHVNTISNFLYNNEKCAISKLSGVYVSKENEIYICDSDGGKILICDKDGNVSKVITAPQKNSLPEGFVFKPTKVIIDPKNYMFILSEGSYYGAMVYNETDEFIGFYGANKVASTVGDVIKNFWKTLTTTNKKRANSAKTLPFSFTDISIDEKGFIYTTTGATTEKGEQLGVIRRLSPNGVNIMKSEDIIFGEKTLGKKATGGYISQDISGLCVDEYGFIYAYDKTIGNIYMYDEECNLITAFGGGMGNGSQNGTYIFPCAIDFFDTKLYVCDALTGLITIYELTDYGKQIRSLQRKTLDGDYLETKTGWEQILKENKNCQLAYIGLANVAISEENYSLALKYAEQGQDKTTYAKAFEKVRDNFISKHFTFLFCISVSLVAIVIVLFIIKKKKSIVLIKNYELKLALSTAIHPFNAFGELKEKKKGKTILAIIFVVLFYISSVIKNDFSGFLFIDTSSIAFNSLVVFLRTIGAVLLWTVSNWMIAALFGGLGKIKEIFIVVSYSLLPMTVANIFYTVFSRVLTESEGSFLALLLLISEVYFVIILAIGTMKIHDFSFGKFVGTSLLSIIGLLLIVFIGAMIVILVQQFVSFFSTLLYEIVLR